MGAGAAEMPQIASGFMAGVTEVPQIASGAGPGVAEVPQIASGFAAGVPQHVAFGTRTRRSAVNNVRIEGQRSQKCGGSRVV